MSEISRFGKELYYQFLANNPEFHQSHYAFGLIESPDYVITESGFECADAQVTHKSETIWGRNCWLNFGRYGYRDQSALKTLFAVLAQTESDAGVSEFYVEVDAKDEGSLKSWFELGFGLQHVSAISRDEINPPKLDELEIRQVRLSDLPSIAVLERELSIHQQASPVFSKLGPQEQSEIISEWEQELENPKLTSRIAEVSGEVIGLAYGCSTELSSLHSGLLRPPNSATFAFCAVLPQFRRIGIASALTASVLTDLRNQGYERIVTDWRATNLLSGNTWQHLSFEPTIFRLHRKI